LASPNTAFTAGALVLDGADAAGGASCAKDKEADIANTAAKVEIRIAKPFMAISFFNNVKCVKQSYGLPNREQT
jgi:hypothetical protein